MKKLISIILTLVMLSASCVSFAATGTPEAYTLDIVNINQTTAGNVKTTTVTVRNYGDTPVPRVTLVVGVKNKATGEVADISMDEETNVTGEVVLSASANLPNTTDYVYEYYVWDNLDNMIPIGNEAPQMPKNLEVASVSNSSVTLSWDAANDDAGVLTYNVFCDGVKVGATTATTYTHYGLEEETTYSYSISAQDGAEEETEQTAEVTATTENLAVVKMSDLPEAWYEDGMPNDTGEGYTGNDGLDVSVVAISGNWPVPPTFVNASAFSDPTLLEANSYSFGEFFGKKAYASYEMNNGKYGIVFMIPSGSPLRTTAGDNTRSIVFDYYDNGISPIKLRYRYDTGSVWKEITAVTRTNTNTWKTCVVTVTDAVFVANNMHLIFASNTGNGDIYISEVGIGKNYVSKVEELNAPQNLSATASSVSSIELEWDSVTALRSEILGYNIYRNGVKIGSTSDTEYTDTGLSEGTAYSYSVSVYSADYESAISVEASAVTLSAFSAPANLAVTESATTTSTITLTWNASVTQGITVLGYNIYRDGIKVDDTTETTYTDTCLDDGIEYTYTVTAYSADDESPSSVEVSASTINIATVKMSDLPASWQENGIAPGTTSGADGLDITGLAENSTALPTFVERAAFDSVSTLEENTYNIGEYFARVAYASNEMSAGKYGMIFMIPSGSPLRTTDGDNTRTIMFDYYDNGTDPIKIRYRYDTGTAWKEITAVTRTNSNTWKTCMVTVDDAVFIANNMHIIFASNTGNGDIYISQVSVCKNYVPKFEVLSAPSNLSAMATSVSEIELSWDSVTAQESEILGYNIYRDGQWIGTTQNTTYTDTGLGEGTAHSYAVTVYSADYESAFSNEATAITLAEFDAPSNLAVTSSATTTSTITLTWDETTTQGIDVLGYYIYRDGERVGDVTETTYTDTGLVDGAEYTYTVTAYSADDESPASTAVNETTRNIASIKMSDIDITQRYGSSGNYYGTGTGDAITSLGMNTSGLTKVSDVSTSTETGAIYAMQEYDGKTCLAVKGNTSNVLLRLEIDDSLITSDYEDVTFFITYYDNSTEPIQFCYYTNVPNSASDSKPKDSGLQTLVAREGEGGWKTAQVRFTNVNFGTADRAFDIYLKSTDDVADYIHEIKVVPTAWLPVE